MQLDTLCSFVDSCVSCIPLEMHQSEDYSKEKLNFFKVPLSLFLGILSGSVVKNPPANAEMQVHPLGWKDPLEKEMTTHSSIHAWEIPWTEERGGLQSMGLQMSDATEHTYTR